MGCLLLIVVLIRLRGAKKTVKQTAFEEHQLIVHGAFSEYHFYLFIIYISLLFKQLIFFPVQLKLPEQIWHTGLLISLIHALVNRCRCFFVYCFKIFCYKLLHVNEINHRAQLENERCREYFMVTRRIFRCIRRTRGGIFKL